VSDVSLLSQEIVGRNEVREEKALPICRSGANLVNMMDLRRRSSVNNANSHLGHASHAPTVECAVPSSCTGGRNSLGRFGAKPGGRSCTDGERFDAALRRATVCYWLMRPAGLGRSETVGNRAEIGQLRTVGTALRQRSFTQRHLVTRRLVLCTPSDDRRPQYNPYPPGWNRAHPPSSIRTARSSSEQPCVETPGPLG
jgi:hypothetical protein